MPIEERQRGCILSGNTGSISIHINDAEFSINTQEGPIGDVQREQRAVLPAVCHLFEHSQEMPTPLPERFPRLTFFAIALSLLAFTLVAECDYLRGAGYYWP
jgi:hypothetical protein